MFRTTVPVRTLAILAVGVLALGAVAFRPQPAAAQIPEYTGYYSEYLVTNPTITRTQPSLSAPIYTTLQPNTVIYVINRFFTSDGIYWGQFRDPAGNYLGFGVLNGPTGTNPVVLQNAGTSLLVGGYPRYVTGVSPFVTVNPFITPFSLIPRQIYVPQQIFVPNVGFFR